MVFNAIMNGIVFFISFLDILVLVHRNATEDFPGGVVVKNLPANVGDMSLSPAQGRFHVLWSN